MRFGFVIVDSERRGQGLGKSMLAMAENYAFDFLGAEKITLGVFENNPAALHCYLAAGFSMIGTEDGYYSFHGEEWKCTEMELIHKE
ncbi:N-acetyltransferase [Ruminococcus sp.]|uniref:GNAT family N-acetyltransferase n=1 Tax=Ruminococcus sp. TaxID=41978 RepID=UPI00258E496B|nr:N-acetyltransferase [Ruminococcus sp.]MCR5020146.1 GNAT family N-acetyltransferase [Ruminococcus sp.]